MRRNPSPRAPGSERLHGGRPTPWRGEPGDPPPALLLCWGGGELWGCPIVGMGWRWHKCPPPGTPLCFQEDGDHSRALYRGPRGGLGWEQGPHSLPFVVLGAREANRRDPGSLWGAGPHAVWGHGRGVGSMGSGLGSFPVLDRGFWHRVPNPEPICGVHGGPAGSMVPPRALRVPTGLSPCAVPAEQEPTPSSGLGVIGFNTALTRHEDIITERINRGGREGAGAEASGWGPCSLQRGPEPPHSTHVPSAQHLKPPREGVRVRGGPSQRGQSGDRVGGTLPSRSLGAGGCVGSGRGFCWGLLKPNSAPVTICAPVCVWVCARGGARVCTEAQLRQDRAHVCMGACTRV